MSSDYPQPQRGNWVTFHRDPIYTAYCHHRCHTSSGHQGYPWVGQVEGRHHEPVYGRPAYRIRYWHETKRGDLEALTTVLSADRLIAIVPHPHGMPALLDPPIEWEAEAA